MTGAMLKYSLKLGLRLPKDNATVPVSSPHYFFLPFFFPPPSAASGSCP